MNEPGIEIKETLALKNPLLIAGFEGWGNALNVSGGMAEYDIQISGNAEQLARELDQRDMGGFSLAVTGATANKVNVRAVRAVTEPNAEIVE